MEWIEREAESKRQKPEREEREKKRYREEMEKRDGHEALDPELKKKRLERDAERERLEREEREGREALIVEVRTERLERDAKKRRLEREERDRQDALHPGLRTERLERDAEKRRLEREERDRQEALHPELKKEREERDAERKRLEREEREGREALHPGLRTERLGRDAEKRRLKREERDRQEALDPGLKKKRLERDAERKRPEKDRQILRAGQQIRVAGLGDMAHEGGLRALGEYWLRRVLVAFYVECDVDPASATPGWELRVQCLGGVELYYSEAAGSWNFRNSNMREHKTFPGGPKKKDTFYPPHPLNYYFVKDWCYARKSEKLVRSAPDAPDEDLFAVGALIACVMGGQMALGATGVRQSNGEGVFVRTLGLTGQEAFNRTSSQPIVNPGRGMALG
ncbi:hypothetical protein B484DRAFT_414425 [Ochromonadaceae sp. CCMP2298]|nr:hypothetical protein B484DRAFT_414425 [Ochromonadaceae sp. CCMP2298]